MSPATDAGILRPKVAWRLLEWVGGRAVRCFAIASGVNGADRPITEWPRELRGVPADAPVLVVGGSFDPPHAAHVALPMRVREVVAPGAVLLFIPASASPFKAGMSATPAEHRVAMVRLAIAGVSLAGVWTDEIDRSDSPSYSIDTLRRLRQIRPGAPILMLIGADQAALFHKWREPRGILELARMLVVRRTPFETNAALLGELRRAGFWDERELAQWERNIVEVPLDPVSATAVRDMIHARGVKSVASLLVPGVLEYIQDKGLYA